MPNVGDYVKWHKMVDVWRKLDRSYNDFSEGSLERYTLDFYRREKRELDRVATQVPFFVLPDESIDEPWGKCTDEYERLLEVVGEQPLPFNEFVIEQQRDDGLRYITRYVRHLDGEIYCDVFIMQTEKRCWTIVAALHQKMSNGEGVCWNHLPDELIPAIFHEANWQAQDKFEQLIVLLHTKGMDQTRFTGRKFNPSSGTKPRVPSDVTVIRIGHYYSSDGARHEYDHRKPVRIHWRRGHTRRVWCGTGENRHTEERYIYPCLVNYKPGDEMPKQQIRIVS